MLKRLISMLIAYSLIVSVVYATKAGIEVRKAVNNAYEITTPVEFNLQSKLPFLPKAYLKFQPVFVAPRGEFFSSMKSANHARFDTVVGSGITFLGGNLEFETGASYWWAGSGQPEGWEFQNNIRYYWQWD